MQSITTKYVMYFNRKYRRVGSLFQGRYKTVRIESESQLIGVSKYIHRNPLPENFTRSDLVKLGEYRYSSYRNYLGLLRQPWLHSGEIISHYPISHGPNSYQAYVEESGDVGSVYREMIDLDK